MVVVNNQGGGIFRILPGHKDSTNFDAFFETTHQLSAKELCKMHGIAYASATTMPQLKNKLASFYADAEAPKLLEIFTPRTLNDDILLEYFNFIK